MPGVGIINFQHTTSLFIKLHLTTEVSKKFGFMSAQLKKTGTCQIFCRKLLFSQVSQDKFLSISLHKLFLQNPYTYGGRREGSSSFSFSVGTCIICSGVSIQDKFRDQCLVFQNNLSGHLRARKILPYVAWYIQKSASEGISLDHHKSVMTRGTTVLRHVHYTFAGIGCSLFMPF